MRCTRRISRERQAAAVQADHAQVTVAARGNFVCGERASTPYTTPSSRSARSSSAASAPADSLVPRRPSVIEADRLAVALRGARDRLVEPLSRSAAAFVRQRAWRTFGFARLSDLARERLGRSGRWLRDLAALGDALESLPSLAEALRGEDGGRPLGRVAALLTGRIASAASVHLWIELARNAPVRELREAVRTARKVGSVWPPGSDPVEEPEQRRGVDRMGVRVDSQACGENPDPDRQESASGENRSLDDSPRIASEDHEADRWLVRFLVPSSVRAAFDEALELHRAVCGQETSVSSFVEDIVAEAYASAHPPDAEIGPLKRGIDAAMLEAAMARCTNNWQDLEELKDASEAISLAGITLGRLDEVSELAGSGGPAELDSQLRELVALEEEIDRRLGQLLAEMGERGAWGRLLFCGVGHYAEQRLGISRTTAEDRASLARSLRNLRRLREAYEGGKIGFEAALLVRRILGRGPVESQVESAWVSRAEEATVKRLRDELRALGRGRPYAIAHPDAMPLEDAVWHESLRRGVGIARERVARFGRQAAEAPSFPDVFLRLRLPKELAESFLGSVESRRRQLTAIVEQVGWHDAWSDPNAAPSMLAARMFSIRCRRVPAWVGLLALIEEFVNTWDDPAASPKRGADLVYIRDGWRCMGPGCTSRRNLEDHHIIYRSRGGSNDLWNRICLCRFHHLIGEHSGLASCRGTAPVGVDWRLGKVEVGVFYRNERRALLIRDVRT